MPRKNTTGRGANGNGSIRKITTTRNGKTYTYWQARYTEGFDPGTGKQIQRSITGKTQAEVAKKLKQFTHELDEGRYVPPSDMTVGEWLDIWYSSYLLDVKARTLEIYEVVIRKHIKPNLGAVKLDFLTPIMVQNFYNNCYRHQHLSAKSMRNINCVLHSAMKQAVINGIMRTNPTENCMLPKVPKNEIRPFEESDIRAFLEQIKGDELEALLIFTLFTGLREGEVMGLRWDCVNFDLGTLNINKQLQRVRVNGKGSYQLISPKNRKGRIIEPSSFVMDLLWQHKLAQKAKRAYAGSAWNDLGFVFTDDFGRPYHEHIVYRHFKRAATAIGRPDARFHDLRHSYAVASLRAGDDIKTLQSNLGHATAAFTLDVYGHMTDQMRQVSSERMSNYIENVLGLKSLS